MKTKRILSVLLIAALLLGVAAVSSSAASVVTSKDGLWKYQKLSDGTLSITSGLMYEKAYLGNSASLSVPESIDGFRVSEIGDYAFYKSGTLKSVTVPGTVTSIEANSFEGCTKLESVAVKNGVEKIGAEAFKSCSSLKSITLPDSVISLAASAFTGTAFYNNSSNWQNGGLYINRHLVRVNAQNSFPVRDGTLNIALGAFNGCNALKEIVIPASVTRIYWNSVGAISALEKITVSSENKSYSSLDGVLFSKDKKQLIIYPAAKKDAAYSVPEGVKSLENSAFRGAVNLKSVSLPDSVESIGIYAFTGAAKLESVSIGDNVKYIGNSAFLNTAFYGNSANWEDGVLYAGKYLIKSENGKTQYNVKDGTLLIAGSAFSSNTSLEKITIPDSVGVISDFAFYYCKALKEIRLPDLLTRISPSCFENCGSLESVTIPDSVTSIGSLAFNNCGSLKTVYGYTFSLAEEYAKQSGLKFVSLGEGYRGFPDVAFGSWYYDAVKHCAQNGYISGYQNGKFGPNDNLKRQDFVVILSKIAGADLDKYAKMTPKLKDVKKGAYYAAAVNWAVDNNIIAGYANGNFGVNDNITREQVATILYRYMGSPEIKDVDSTLKKFSDVNRISTFAKTAVAWAVQNNVISGMADGRVAPTEGAARAQIASIIMRMDQQGMFDKS